jgi:hypothetical protein
MADRDIHVQEYAAINLPSSRPSDLIDDTADVSLAVEDVSVVPVEDLVFEE